MQYTEKRFDFKFALFGFLFAVDLLGQSKSWKRLSLQDEKFHFNVVTDVDALYNTWTSKHKVHWNVEVAQFNTIFKRNAWTNYFSLNTSLFHGIRLYFFVQSKEMGSCVMWNELKDEHRTWLSSICELCSRQRRLWF